MKKALSILNKGIIGTIGFGIVANVFQNYSNEFALSNLFTKEEYENALRYICINLAIDKKEKEKELIRKTWNSFEYEKNNRFENEKIGENRPKDALRIVSFNCNQMRNINKINTGLQILELVKRLDGDILALQEVCLPDGDYGCNFFEQMSLLGYIHVVYHRENYSKEIMSSCGNAIFSRIEIKDSAILELEYTKKNAVIAKVNIPNVKNGKITEIPVSVASLRLSKYPSKNTIKLIQENEIPIEYFNVEGQLENLNEKLSKNNFENLFLAGSFNALSSLAYNQNESLFSFKNMIKVGSKNHKTQFKELNQSINKFDLKHSESSCCVDSVQDYIPYTHFSGRVVDFVFLFNKTWNKQLCVRNVFIYHTNVSDHLPIILDISSID